MKFGYQAQRILKQIGIMILLVHLFSCFWYMCSKYNNFENDTWVMQMDFIDRSDIETYYWCLYWAFQTLTTVGYGDFGAYNTYEIILTIIWMGFGVAFYSIVVGTLTSIFTEQIFDQVSLSNKVIALQRFSQEQKLDKDLFQKLMSFLKNNYLELFRKVDEETLVSELPSTIKEEVLFHQYGSIIKKFLFFKKQNNNEFVWLIVKQLDKIQFDKGDIIYHDNNISECMYLIHKGIVKLFAENDFPYAVYRESTSFGDYDVFLNQRRNGTAKSVQQSQLYKL